MFKLQMGELHYSSFYGLTMMMMMIYLVFSAVTCEGHTYNIIIDKLNSNQGRIM